MSTGTGAHDTVEVATSHRGARRQQLLGTATLLLFAAGLVLAAVRPPRLVGPLEAAVAEAGAWAPVVFVALTALLTPLHLNGVLVVLSPVVWPVPVAAALSVAGSLLGCALAWALLVRIGARSFTERPGWPSWLTRMVAGVERRPYAVGFVARFLLGSGLALEAFYVLTGYTRRQYLTVTALGVAAWTAQALLGVTVLRAAVTTAPWVGVLAVLVPVGTLAGLVTLRRHRTRPRPS